MRIETKRLILREWEDKDKGDTVEGINNLNVSKWLLVVPHPYKKKDADWWINHCKEKIKKKPREGFPFAILLKSEKKVIGGISLDKIDKFQGKASVGYWLNEKYWRNGYGTEAFDALLKFAFNKLKLRRVEAGVFAGNPSSCKLLEKFGAKFEGVKRKSCRSKATGKIMDELFYGLLKEEWKKLR